MWGKANYFAVNASYSSGYSHDLKNGTFQMFYARVILGNYKELGSDNTLREPPMIEGTTIRHDSVKGHTGGSDVFMIYSNKKAYPEYLITFKKG